jgi:deoxyhypusine synthase
MRDYIRYLCEHKMISAIVTTTGGIEEDIMKTMAPTYIGDFALKGSELRSKGINRIGNLLIPNNNYSLLEEWFLPLVKEMHKEQKEKGTIFSPSKIIRRIGEKINNKESIYYWCAKNDIPVYCPAFTDGALGDVVYFQTWREEGFIIDLVQDIKMLNDSALRSKKSGQIILGGGVIKHHINNANLMRNGADFSVYINTA